MNDVTNGSATLKVSRLSRCFAGSGSSSQWMIDARKAYATAAAATSATSETTRRLRSSSRCSTSDASSPWPSRRGSRTTAIACPARRLWRVVALDRRRGGSCRRGGGLGGRRGQLDRPRRHLLVVVVLAGDRVLELAHPFAHRAADLRQALGAEDEEQHDREDDQLRESDEARHRGGRVAAFGPGSRSPRAGGRAVRRRYTGRLCPCSN